MTVLETERLILCRPDAADWPGYAALLTSERGRMAGGVISENKAWRAFAVEIGHWEIRGYGMFSVRERETGESLGMVGPWYPLGWPEQEIGWILWTAAEGRGIAYEATLAARAHVFDTLGWGTAVSYIHPENARSIVLAERLGAVRDPDATPLDPDGLVYRHPHPNETSEVRR